ncbi:MAG: hypothetical protein Q8K40_06370 [Ignavibacteria bacterium]|nr:hypothetical protein [Ignavibacteria bacterium]
MQNKTLHIVTKCGYTFYLVATSSCHLVQVRNRVNNVSKTLKVIPLVATPSALASSFNQVVNSFRV